ncbi:MAG: TonB-dependent receptor [Gammaproteobacteria bacterium]|nr:TonB-dependent receptor [Gammaproteobacteria bacterium]MDH4253426.1 TonB-dependent receptor [Gammaproteobacteria bacterium]MDH5309211.1 TonB-dependent receptor [Gammaproteobacteria bacterium]
MSAAADGTLASIITLFACAAPWQAGAQEESINEIQVTATRRPVESGKLSAALALIPAGKASAGPLVTDLLVAEPGVFRQQTTPGQGAAIVRGLKGSEVLHLVDGMRLNNAIFRNAPTQYLALVSPGSVERIELLRGSPTSLYGSDAVGGVINVITRRPEFGGAATAYRGDLGLALDSAEQLRSVQGTAEAGNERAGLLLSGDYLETGHRRIGGGERIVPSGYKAWGARAALLLAPDDETEWFFDLQTGRQPRTPRVDELVPGFGQSEPSSAEYYFEPNERHFAHVQHVRRDGWFSADWTVDLGWQRIVDDLRTRDFGSDIRTLEQNGSDLVGGSVLASDDGERISWVAGVEIYHDEVSSRRVRENVVDGNRRIATARYPDGSTMDQAAAFVNMGGDIGVHSTLSGGIRLSRVRLDLPATDITSVTGIDLDDWSADLGWSFDVTEAMQFVANLGYGFRAPNVFDVGTLGARPGNRFNVPNPDLESERALMLDAGIKHRGARLDAEFIVWHLSYRDRIASVLTGEVTPDGRDVVQSQNFAAATSWGVEFAATAELTERALLDVVLNHSRGEQQEADGSDAPADRMPPANGRVALVYDWNAALRIEPYLVFALRQERLSPRDANDIRIDPNGTPGWLTLNLRADWQPDERWQLTLALENLLDARYRYHGSGIDAPGLNVLLELRRRW